MANHTLLILTPNMLYWAVNALPKTARIILYEDRHHVLHQSAQLRVLVRTALLAYRDRLLVKGRAVELIHDGDYKALLASVASLTPITFDIGLRNPGLTELKDIFGQRLGLRVAPGITHDVPYTSLVLPTLDWEAAHVPVFEHNDRYEQQANQELGLQQALRFPVSHTDILDEAQTVPDQAAINRIKAGLYLGLVTPLELLAELAMAQAALHHKPAWITVQAKRILGVHEYRSHARS
jgi:hypothetical protein